MSELAKQLESALQMDVRDQSSYLWKQMVYEPKRDFHLNIERDRIAKLKAGLDQVLRNLPDETHRKDVSVAWPANHFFHVSVVWPEQHEKSSSLDWVPNAPPPSNSKNDDTSDQEAVDD